MWNKYTSKDAHVLHCVGYIGPYLMPLDTYSFHVQGLQMALHNLQLLPITAVLLGLCTGLQQVKNDAYTL